MFYLKYLVRYLVSFLLLLLTSTVGLMLQLYLYVWITLDAPQSLLETVVAVVSSTITSGLFVSLPLYFIVGYLYSD